MIAEATIQASLTRCSCVVSRTTATLTSVTTPVSSLAWAWKPRHPGGAAVDDRCLRAGSQRPPRDLVFAGKPHVLVPRSEESAGAVDLAPQLVEMLRTWKMDALGPFVIASPNPPRYDTRRTNYRAQREFLEPGVWLEGKGVSARKKLHELRKECGAVTANSLGIFAASRALRHADIRITSQRYMDKKVRVTTGLDALLT